MKVHDDSMAVGRKGFSRLMTMKEGWTDGDVVTPWGIVSVYAQGDDRYRHHTRLDIVHNGRLYMRDFHGKRYSPRGLVMKAMQFAREIAG